MSQIQKYMWLINTIKRYGPISLRDLSDRWEREKDLSDCKPLPRATFNRWREAVASQFAIDISYRSGLGYQIENPEEIDDDKLKKWMLDSFAVGNLLGENLLLKDRILLSSIPSGGDRLTAIIEAMKADRKVKVTYRHFTHCESATFLIEPYCVKLFENRWYVLGRNNFGDIKIYAFDRILEAEVTEARFRLPKDFDAADFFGRYYGVMIDHEKRAQRIVLRARGKHKYYMQSLPLHDSQRLVEDSDNYADFEYFLVPTFDLELKLLQFGSMVEVLEPACLRDSMRDWVSEMAEIYKEIII